VAEITGRKIPVRVGKRREGDPPVLCASPRRIMQELQWKPEHSSLREILASAWEWKMKQLGVCSPASSR
jgi:UDP-glucose 4-epimerase